MITEEQRRALFALREALNLCDSAHLMISLNEDGPGLTVESLLSGPTTLASVGVYLCATDIDALLAEHPEDEPEPGDHGFKVGQRLRCLHVPNRHDGYFTPGCTYEVDAVDTSDTFLPLLMHSDESMTLWCEASAFEATV